MRGLLVHACPVLNHLSTNIFHLSLKNQLECAIFSRIIAIITKHQIKHIVFDYVVSSWRSGAYLGVPRTLNTNSLRLCVIFIPL